MPITVSNSSELYSALRACKGGETILLEGGRYGSLNINDQSGIDRDFASTVTIASADPNNPAVFSSADVRKTSNLTVDGVTFDYTFKPGDAYNKTPFVFQFCENLTIKDSTFDGDEAYGMSASDNGFGFGIGLRVRGSTNTVIEGNESYGFWRGMTFDNNANLTVRENDLHSMRLDGMTFVKADGVLIEDNYMHDFRSSSTSPAHHDMIQFWTASTTQPSVDVVIRGNVLDIGKGTPTQSIFMGNEVVSADQSKFDAMAYRNVTIEDNTIINGHQWGIYISDTKGLTISRNTLVHGDGNKPDGSDHPSEMPQINVDRHATNVVVTDNVAFKVLGYIGQSDWSVWDNPTELGEDAGGEMDTVSVRVSGDEWRADPAFRLTVNGDTVATSSAVTADRDEGEWQTVTFKGDFGLDGSDRVGVSFINDAWGGTSSTDRNLYVDQVSLNDQVNTTNLYFARNGTQYLDF